MLRVGELSKIIALHLTNSNISTTEEEGNPDYLEDRKKQKLGFTGDDYRTSGSLIKVGNSQPLAIILNRFNNHYRGQTVTLPSLALVPIPAISCTSHVVQCKNSPVVPSAVRIRPAVDLSIFCMGKQKH